MGQSSSATSPFVSDVRGTYKHMLQSNVSRDNQELFSFNKNRKLRNNSPYAHNAKSHCQLSIYTRKIDYLSAKRRAISAIIGAFVADAVTTSLSLIYDETYLQYLYFHSIHLNTNSCQSSLLTLKFDNSDSLELDRKSNIDIFSNISIYSVEVMPLFYELANQGYYNHEIVLEQTFRHFNNYKGSG